MPEAAAFDRAAVIAGPFVVDDHHGPLVFDIAFTNPRDWKPLLMQEGSSSLEDVRSGFFVPVEILSSKLRGNGRYLYRAKIPPNGDDRLTFQLIPEAPREAFYFLDKPYSTDMFLKHAFRHEIGLPEDLFPEIWKNRK